LSKVNIQLENLPNGEDGVVPNSVLLVAAPDCPKDGEDPNPVVVEPNVEVPGAPNKDVDVETPKVGVVVVPKLLLPNVVDWLGDEPKPPKLDFCPNRDPEKFAEYITGKKTEGPKGVQKKTTELVASLKKHR
jgi:hypothetical protein